MYSMKKYILALLLLVAPALSAQQTIDERIDAQLDVMVTKSKILDIIKEVVNRLEDEYSEYINYRLPLLKIHVLNEKEYAEAFCRIFSSSGENPLYSNCVEGKGTEAFYRHGEFFFRDTIDLDSAWGMGTVIHEAVHFVQDRHGLLDARCVEWAEYEATKLEQELLVERGLWLTPSDKHYYAKWRNIYSMKLNEERTDCK